MKKDIHPNYRPVVFKDLASDTMFLCASTIKADKNIKYEDGNEYPLVEIEISSASHPFYTGTEKILDTGGRVERFKQKQAAALARQEAKKKKEDKKAGKKSVKEVFEVKKEDIKTEEAAN